MLHALPAGDVAALTGRGFFPRLIAHPFHTALVYAFVFAIAVCLIAAIASLLRGGKYHHEDEPALSPPAAVGLEQLEPAAAAGRL